MIAIGLAQNLEGMTCNIDKLEERLPPYRARAQERWACRDVRAQRIDRKSIATIQAALRRGITLIDTGEFFMEWGTTRC